MPMYNLLQYVQNYSMTSGSLWNYYRDQIDDVGDNALDGKSFEYKTKIAGKTPAQPWNEGDTNRPPVPMLKSLFHSNMLLIFGDLLICLWCALK